MTDFGLTDHDRADLDARLASWFGDDRQAFLVAHLAPVVDRIKSEACAQAVADYRAAFCRVLERCEELKTSVARHQWDALEMARKAEQAERRAEDAEVEVERLKVAADCDAVRCPCGAPVGHADHCDSCCSGCGAAGEHEHMATVEHLRRCPICDMRFVSSSCDHQWIDRPESDTAACDLCGAER